MVGIGLLFWLIGIVMMFVCQEKLGKTIGWALTIIGCGFVAAV